MTTAVQHRRGSTSEHSTFTGLVGEVTIDTTKDTAVIHDGSLAGGYPLAKENLSNVTPTGLPTIDGASTASDDKFFIYDQSASVLKSITRAELNNAIEQDALANVAITGGTINGTSVGATTPSTGAFTTLSSSSTTILNGTTIPASKTLVTLDNTQTLTNKTLTSPVISGGSIDNAAIGATTAAGGAFTTLTTSGAVTHNGGTANGVAYLNGSKVLTTGSALTFNGSNTFTVIPATGTAYSRTESTQYSTWLQTGAGNANVFWEFSAGTPVRWVDTSAGELMRLTSTGLGIGTSSPYSKLTISSGASNDTRLLLQSNASGGAVNAGLMLGLIGSNGYVYNYANGPIIFGTNGADRATLDSSGNLGLGVTPSAWGGGSQAFQNGGGAVFQYNNDRIFIAQNNYIDGAFGDKYITNGYATRYRQYAGAHAWFTAPSGTAGNAISFTQSMTLDSSGNLLVGTTSSGGEGGVSIQPNISNGAGRITFDRASTTASSTVIVFENGNVNSGTISYTNTTTTYATSSDYRLKENIQPMTGALAKVVALKPCTYKWKADGSDGEGFIAHELAEVVPQCVTGEKDAVDEDGKPVYQGIDTSFLVATLTAAIQEQQAIITDLRARVAALEAA